MRIRAFITAGDELHFVNICESSGCKAEIGGDTHHDGEIDGMERASQCQWARGSRTDWSVVYVVCDSFGQALQIRAQYRHKLGLDA